MSKVKEIILQLLDTYRGLPCLWDKTHIDYKNRESRNEAHRILLDLYRVYDENANVKTLTKKIENLRTGYYKEFKKVNAAHRLGRTYVPTLFYYDTLSFLSDVVRIDPCHEDTTEEAIRLEVPNLSSDEESDNGRSSKSSSVPPPKRKKPIKVYSDHIYERITDYSEKRTMKMNSLHRHDSSGGSFKMKDEECEILGKSIGLQLRDLNKKQLTITQKIISDAIYYAKIGQLSENSFIALDHPDSHSYPHKPSASYPYHFLGQSNSRQSSHSVSSSTPKNFNPEYPSRYPLPHYLSRLQSLNDPLVKDESQQTLDIVEDDSEVVEYYPADQE